MILFREEKMEIADFTVYAVFHYHSAVAPYLPNYFLPVRAVGCPVKTTQVRSVGAVERLPVISLVLSLSEFKENFGFSPLLWGNGLAVQLLSTVRD